MTTILTVCFSAITGCRGSAAQEPYDGLIADARRPAMAAAMPTPQAEAEPIASEVDVPWAIALLSDVATPVVGKATKRIVASREIEAVEPVAREADLHVAVDPLSPEEKPATPKACNGVVKTRS